MADRTLKQARYLRARFTTIAVLITSFSVLAGCNSSGPEDSQDINEPTIQAANSSWNNYSGPYADTVARAAQRYKGSLDEAALSTDNAGQLLATILHGPLSAVGARPGTVLSEYDATPLNTYSSKYGLTKKPSSDLSAYPGYPTAIMARSGIGVLPSYKISYNLELRWQDVLDREDAGQLVCLDSGDVSWSAELGPGGALSERSVTWNACRQHGTEINGSVRLRREISIDGIAALFISWDDVVYTANLHSFMIAGVESWPQGEGCGIDRPRVSNVLIESLYDGYQIFLDNLSASMIGFESCTASGLTANHYIGRIFDSRFGVATIDTPQHLASSSMSLELDRSGVLAIDPDDADKSHNGRLLISGANDSEVELTLNSFSRFAEQVSDEYKWPEAEEAVQIQVRSSDRAPQSFQFGIVDARRGAMADLRDSDGDGVPNAWELVAGHNPSKDWDAALDADSDGKSVAEEQSMLTSDKQYNLFEPEVDDAILLFGGYGGRYVKNHSPREIYDNEYVLPDSYANWRSTVSVEIPKLGRDTYAEMFRYSLLIEGDGQFISHSSFLPDPGAFTARWTGPDICSLSQNDKRLDCTVSRNHNCKHEYRIGYFDCEPGGLGPLFFAIGGPTNAKLTVTANLEAGSLDNNLSNNIAVREIPAQ